MMTRLRGYYLVALVASVAILMVTLIAWGLWSFGGEVVSSVTEWVVKPTPTETSVPTQTTEPTTEPTRAATTKAKVVVKEVVVVVTATSQPTIEPTAEPTMVPTAMPIAEGSPNPCGFTLPPDWVESSDGMSGVGRKANAEITVGSGEVAFIWATKVNQIQGRVLVVQKGPYKGNYELLDGAFRVGHLADMTDSGIGSAAAHVQTWLACSYGPEWSPTQWSPPNQSTP